MNPNFSPLAAKTTHQKDQTATDQVRTQFGEEAADAIAERFAERGAGAESVVVFTHDRSKTIDNVAADYEVGAVLTAGRVSDTLNRILVSLRGEDNIERIFGFVGMLLCESDATATIFNFAESDEEASRGELLVRGACDKLEDDEEIEPARIDWRQDRDGSATNAITEAAEDYNLLIVSNRNPR